MSEDLKYTEIKYTQGYVLDASGVKDIDPKLSAQVQQEMIARMEQLGDDIVRRSFGIPVIIEAEFTTVEPKELPPAVVNVMGT